MVREGAVASPNRTLANKQGGLPMDPQLLLKPQKSTETRGVSVGGVIAWDTPLPSSTRADTTRNETFIDFA